MDWGKGRHKGTDSSQMVQSQRNPSHHLDRFVFVEINEMILKSMWKSQRTVTITVIQLGKKARARELTPLDPKTDTAAVAWQAVQTGGRTQVTGAKRSPWGPMIFDKDAKAIPQRRQKSLFSTCAGPVGHICKTTSLNPHRTFKPAWTQNGSQT